MGLLEKIKQIEEEMSITQKNKHTEYHLGILKAKLARFRTELLEPTCKGGKGGEGFEVRRYGNARVCMIGFPSVGKSTLLTELTPTYSEIAAYEFTTLTCIPGVIKYKESEIQLLDLPGIIEGASEGRGRGRQVIAVGKASDLILMVLDAAKHEEQKTILTRELDKVGIRLNKKQPDISVTYNKVGGVRLLSTKTLTQIDEKMVKNVCAEYKIHNIDILAREDVTIDDIIDKIEGNRKYVKCLYVYNKIDAISLEEVNELARQPDSAVISCQLKLGYDMLLEKIWEKLDLVRIYTKRPSKVPDLKEPIILTNERNGVTIKSVVEQIHKNLINDFAFAKVWGRSAKFYPQKVGLIHVLMDEDVLQIFKKQGIKKKDEKNKAIIQRKKDAHQEKEKERKIAEKSKDPKKDKK